MTGPEGTGRATGSALEELRRVIGEPMLRREDDALVRGAAHFTDDLGVADGLPEGEMLAMVVVRATVAHAAIAGIDVADAMSLPDVVAVVAGAEIADGVLPYPVAAREGAELADAPMVLIASTKVRFVGEVVAVVLARSRAAAEDAAELVVVDYEPLPAVVSAEDARLPTSVVHDSAPDNVLVRWSHTSGDVDGAFAGAASVVACHERIPRLAAAPIEVRTCVAAYDPERDLVTLWASAQDPWRQAVQLAKIFNRAIDGVRVVVPEVGGAFGSKGALVPEYGLAAWCALRFGATVRYFEDRSENLLASYQGRGMEAEVELALDPDGRFLALRARLTADVGAYLYPSTANVSTTTATLMTGCYAIPAVHVDLAGMATTKVPTGPYRGAGRPEAAFFVERLVDVAARATGIDPVELRRRNLVASDRFPYANGLGMTYDSGDYVGALDEACALLDYRAARAAQASARAEGRLVGVGVASYVERAAPAGWESAEVVIETTGRIVVRPGSSPHGQGHETTFAQIAAECFACDPGLVDVRHGDSAKGAFGVGTFGSRSVTLGGSAIHLACTQLLERAGSVAAVLLGEAPGAVTSYARGEWSLAGGDRNVGLAEVALAAEAAGAPLIEQARFTIEGPVFSFGVYAAVVEIDPETGRCRVDRIVAVDDAGVIVNPLLAEGQVVGSTVQGFGASLFEEVVHDAEGQPLSASFVSYGLASAPDLEFELQTAFRCTPSPLNPLGAKGLGEAGTIGVPAAIGNAVVDALAPLGVSHVDPPYTPERLWRLVDAAGVLSNP